MATHYIPSLLRDHQKQELEKKRGTTFKVEESDVFSRIRSFLPEMKKSTLNLQEQLKSGELNQQDILIEQFQEESNCEDAISEDLSQDSDDHSTANIQTSQQIIEICLGLGVFDVVNEIENPETLSHVINDKDSATRLQSGKLFNQVLCHLKQHDFPSDNDNSDINSVEVSSHHSKSRKKSNLIEEL